MSLDTAMLTGVSGISSFGNAMNVIGDNIANVNTVGFKGSSAQFSNMLSSAMNGGGSSFEIGRGSYLSGVLTGWAQGSFQTSGTSTDMAIQGSGFFIVKDQGTGANYYTRDGQFTKDKNSNLVNAQGYVVQGYNMVQPTGAVSNINMANMQSNPPKATQNYTLGANLDTTTKIATTANITATAGSANITLSANGTTYPVGAAVQFLTSNTLPGGLSPNTPYYVVSNTGGATPTVTLSATLGGAPITLTSAGTGTNTITTSPAPTPAYTTTFDLYDAQGNRVTMTANFWRTTIPANITNTKVANDWSYQLVPPTGMTIGGGSGTLEFDGTGALVGVNSNGATLGTANPKGITITQPVGGANPLSLTWNLFDANGNPSITSYAAPSSTLNLTQDGYSTGFLKALSVDGKGVLSGIFTNGQTQSLYQLQLADFPNITALNRIGGSLYSPTMISGQALTGVAGSGGLGSILGSSLELSNVDLASEFVKMVQTQRAYEANSKIITTSDQLMSTTVNIVR